VAETGQRKRGALILKVLVTGGSGMLGQAVVQHLSKKFHVSYTVHRSPAGHEKAAALACDLTERAVKFPAFDAIIHTAAMTDVDYCQQHPDEARRNNVLATANLVQACPSAYFVYVSTDFVFNGNKGNYTEADAPDPISVYGQTKYEGEKETPSFGCVLRTSIYGLGGNSGKLTFIEKTLGKLKSGQQVLGFEDQWFSPMSIYNLAELIAEILLKKPAGVLHLGGPERVSKFEFMRLLAKSFGYPENMVKANSFAGYNFIAPRPRDASLNIAKAKGLLGVRFWNLEESLEDIKNDRI
jgi:dTDP-4-dehydrorhamnose reductase